PIAHDDGRRRAKRRNGRAGNGKAALVLNGAEDRTGSERRDVRHRLRLGNALREHDRRHTEKHQNDERRLWGSASHALSVSRRPALAPARGRSRIGRGQPIYDGPIVKFTSRVRVLFAIVSVTLISSRYSPSGNDANGTACPLCS